MTIRDLAVGSGGSQDDCQRMRNANSKKQKVITLRRQLTLLAFELQPHPSFSAIRRQGDSYTRGTQPAVLPMPRSLTEASRANL